MNNSKPSQLNTCIPAPSGCSLLLALDNPANGTGGAFFIPSPLYQEILKSIPIACVDVAIMSNGSILLVKRNDAPATGQWWLPGGRVLKGEMMRDTARRKAYEEVGLDCHIGPIVHTAETIFEDGPNGIPVHSINSCFLAYSADNKVRLDSHHSGYRWVSSISDELHPYVKDCLIGAGL